MIIWLVISEAGNAVLWSCLILLCWDLQRFNLQLISSKAVAAVSCCFFCSSIVSVLFFPSVILLDNGLIKAEMTPYLTHTHLVTRIRSSVVYFFALGWHVALLGPDCGPDLANRSGLSKCHYSTLHVDQIIIPHVPGLGRHYVAIWDYRQADVWLRLYQISWFVGLVQIGCVWCAVLEF